MTNPLLTIDAAVFRSRPRAEDKVLGVAEARMDGEAGAIYLTTRGLYLVIDGGAAFGIDLNALAKALVAAVSPLPPGGDHD